MRKLQTTPSQAGYAVDFADNVRRVSLEGGPSRTRLAFLGGVNLINVSWNLSPAGYDYLQAFYRTATQQGSEEFLVDLVVDRAALTEYTAKFVPGSLRTTGVRGLTTSVSATIEAKPSVVVEAVDDLIMDLYEDYGEEASTALSDLAHLVNVVAPQAIPG